MKEQIYTINKIKDFNIKQIIECGQCFRWNKEPDGSYTGIVKNNVINVFQQEKQITFCSYGDEDIQELVKNYFDLETDYEAIKSKLQSMDTKLIPSIQFGNGIRILNQEIWECIISFILSANNNIPRIKKMIEHLSKTYGKKIIWKGNEYYTFPTPEELSKADIPTLRKLGLGFRDKRVYETTQMILKQEIDIETLKQERDVEKIRETLLTMPGIGEKVADCILLFSFKKMEVFPIDVWVKRVMNELYLQKEENKIKSEEIRILAKERYQSLAGIAQQYLFYWKRETS